MSESVTTPTHSAAWHYERAEEYLSQSSYFTRHPSEGGAELVNPEVQRHLLGMAHVHALLANAGAAILANVAHGNPGKNALINHATGTGTREV